MVLLKPASHPKWLGWFRWLACLSFLMGLVTIAPSVHASELNEIEQRGYLIVGVKDNLPPLGFITTDGELAGLEIELSRWLAAQLLGDPQAVVFQPLTNQARLEALLNDEVDLVIARLTMTSSRARLLDFSLPYYLDGTALITNQGTVQRLSDLRQQPIAVLNGSDTIAVIRFYLPDAQLIGVDSYDEAMAALETNQAIAFAADATVLTGWVQAHPHYRLLPFLLSTEALAVAMPRGIQYDDLRRQVNAAIAQWQIEGMLRERILYWGLPEDGIPPGIGLEDNFL